LVAATYVYFLLFAQFAFLRLVARAGITDPHGLLALMGAAGIGGGALAAWRQRTTQPRATLVAGFAMGGAGAALAVSAAERATGLFAGAAMLTGSGLGLVTVTLAAALRPMAGGEKLGRTLGVGTGAAYAISNLPAVFLSEPAAQAGVALLAAAAGLALAARWAGPGKPEDGPTPVAPLASPRVAGWVAVLFALVACDSGVFFHIQRTAELRAATWAEPAQLWLNAAAHLGAAWLAGVALDRGRLASALAASAVLLGAGTALIFAGHGAIGAPLYTAGVSVYSTALVYYPARGGNARLAALVYGVAGWIGSAAGIAVATRPG
jgi:cytochrome c oxidase cbb3-type subunit 2